MKKWLLLMFVVTPSLFAADFDHRHRDWTEILRAHVVLSSDGYQSAVDYAALAANPEQLKQYLNQLSAVTPRQYQQWQEAQQLAFLINAYNGFTLQLIVEHYDQFTNGDAESIRDLGSLFRTPWEQSFFVLLGEQRTLDWVEHEKIRVDFNEPRIHAALVCAAASCPKLRTEAFTGSELYAQLGDQMRTFLQDRSKNGIDENGVYLSKIFDWYRQDFNGLTRYLTSYADALSDNNEQRKLLESGDYDIRFSAYDWQLNDVH